MSFAKVFALVLFPCLAGKSGLTYLDLISTRQAKLLIN